MVPDTISVSNLVSPTLRVLRLRKSGSCPINPCRHPAVINIEFCNFFKNNHFSFFSSNTEEMDPIGSDEEYDEEYDKEYDGDYDEEYELEHGDDSCDDEEVPVRVRKEIRKCIMDELFPHVLHYMSMNGCSEFLGVKIEHVSLELLCDGYGSLEPALNKDQQRDLNIMYRTFLLFGKKGYTKNQGKELVGAAIRLSTAIGKEEHAEKLKAIVKDCFTPNEFPDPLDVNFL